MNANANDNVNPDANANATPNGSLVAHLPSVGDARVFEYSKQIEIFN